MSVIITANTKILPVPTSDGGPVGRNRGFSPAVAAAADAVRRDIAYVFGSCDEPQSPDRPAADIVVRIDRTMPAEQYRVTIDVPANRIVVAGADDLGCVYGLYTISREWLGFEDFWFWNDQRPARRARLELADDATLVSKPAAVRYRGWFVNDEVLVAAWNIDNDNERTWRMIFETLLRAGGNLVIPGSGQNMAPHWDLARDMGLYVNQHHATPLGARLFAEAYPGERPRWPEDRERYEALWRESIERLRGAKVVWTLGLRGNCDGPFWVDDPRHATDEDRGRVLSEAMRDEYRLIREADPHAPVSAYLYAESLDLYRKGLLDLPDDVIKIWADNGYGRMQVRRSGNWDPRTPAMPPTGDTGANGIYYHASFFDLQAANHITQMPESPDDIARELDTVLERGGDSLWVVNCSNVKPHVFFLDLIARMWRDGRIGGADGGIRSAVDTLLLDYARRYYGGDAYASAVARLFRGYWAAAASYGPEWDQKCGEQLFTYAPRMIATHYLSGDRGEENDLKWLHDGPFAEQLDFVQRLCDAASRRYALLAANCERTALDLEFGTAFGATDDDRCDTTVGSDGLMAAGATTGIGCTEDADDATGLHAARLIRDTVGLQAVIYRDCARGTSLACTAVKEALANDFKHSFYHAGLAREHFLAADAAMRAREHDVWQGFWANDCLADVKFSGQVMAALMSYLRNRGDGPHYYGWKHEFCYAPQWRNVIVVLNMENHESDDEIFQAMKRRWGGGDPVSHVSA
ncbi:glycosyl hydrolase 115 family protein [Bifidobacterium sp. 82T10]|uniref:Glycosyl hydrolase 115 family protein n=1 Tax=Bifidobacterium miconis TaxID=2834435 RepID=A0ABS6WEC3_9BIFI|nr:glycosyl hydrolase 115 family protein [Bifidobacterium miconis]MBW3092409.1 glycosyl hydrolase 115 family protein [Bifidobacterium miconis]